jgi:small subunit ribosomal protein S4
MARYKDARCKLCRREGVKLFLKGERCYTRGKCPIDKAVNPRNYPPGQHGLGRGRRRMKASDFSIRLREKQKLRKIYGVLETQFRNYFKKAARRKGVTGENLIRMLEMRLDNTVYRMGLAMSRSGARQLVSHGHVFVNGKRVNIPSYQVKVDDVITLAEKAKGFDTVKYSLEWNASRLMPEWISFDAKQVEGKIVAEPARDQVTLPVEEQLVVEYYSRV